MAKDKSHYSCQQCGGTTPRWLGKCPHCGAWNSLLETAPEPQTAGKNRLSAAGPTGLVAAAELAPICDIEAGEVARTPTGQEELDRVLGGGIVAGGVVLIGGDPGIGKSTLLLQALDAMQRQGLPTLYVSGEESAAQLALRARRLGLAASPVPV
ncbi:MAG: DNA repair protein RadA, partial [Burkholderiales bacterium 34-67-9]